MKPTGALRRNIQFTSTAGPPSVALKERVRRPALFNKLARAEDLVGLFRHDDWMGWSGFTGMSVSTP